MTSNALNMYNDLMSIIDEACLPREPQQMGRTIRIKQGKERETSFLIKFVNFIEKILH